MRKTIIITLIVIFFSSCRKESTTSVDIKGELKIFSIQPTIGKPSDVIEIRGAGFDKIYERNIIRFNGVIAQIDSGSEYSLFTRVPLYAKSGNITVYTTKESSFVLVPMDSVTSQTFTVLPFGKQNLNFIQYIGPLLTESQSKITNCMNQSIGWSISGNQDTIILSQGSCVGDDSYITRILRFYIQENDSVPRYVIGLIKDNEIQYTSIDTLKGYIAIQDWKRNNIISGRVTVYHEQFYWWDFNFWYKY